MDSNLIDHMNQVSEFFLGIYAQVKTLKAEGKLTFISLCQILTEHMGKQKPAFSVVIMECNASVYKFTEWYNTMLDTDDNTLMVVDETITEGKFIWTRVEEHERYELSLEIPSKKEKADGIIVLKNDTINSHCGRAILIINPASKEEFKEKNALQERKIKTFVDLVRISQEIKDIKTQLILYGYCSSEAAAKDDVFEIKRYQSDDLIKELKKRKEGLEICLNGWKQALKQARQEIYYMTFIPNNQIPIFLQFFKTPQHDLFAKIQHTLRSIHREITFSKIIDNFEFKNQSSISILNYQEVCQNPFSPFKKLEPFINSYLYNQDEKFSEAGNGKSTIPNGFVLSNSESEMLKDMLQLFYQKNQIPLGYQVMFCERNTRVQDLEIFFMRAFYNNFQKFNAYQPKENRVFILANFQNLTLRNQLEAYKIYQHYQLKDVNQPGVIVGEDGEELRIHKQNDYNKEVFIFFYKPDNKNDKIIGAIKNAEKLSENEKFQTSYDLKTKIFPKLQAESWKFMVVESSRSGLGKSTTIRDEWLKDTNYIRVPIYGNANRQSLAKTHIEYMDKVDCRYSTIIGLHYDIYHTVTGDKATPIKESLNVILFDILILKSINRNASCLYHFEPKKDLNQMSYQFFLEISDEISTNRDLFLFSMPITKFMWETTQYVDAIMQIQPLMITNQLRIKIPQEKDSDIQLVCRYLDERSKGMKKLQMMSNLQIYPQTVITSLQRPTSALDQDYCRTLLYTEFLHGAAEPNFYLLQSYITLFAFQLRRLHQNAFFNCETFYKYKQFGDERQSELVYREVVDSFLNVTKELNKARAETILQDMQLQPMRNSGPNPNQQKLQKYQWSSNIDFILFNDQGSITPVFSDLKRISEGITHAFEKLKDPPKRLEDLTQAEFHKQIKNLVVDTRRLATLKVDMGKLQFTKDNYVKLALIYFRIQSKQSVIIMGETGVGKTSLVQYLSEVMDANFIRMPLHAGVEEATIFEDFDRVIKVAKNDKNKRTVVFLDEINTNEHISGLLKEIIVDRHFKGKIIPENISLVAACNPYKERTEEQMKATEQVGITHPKSSGRQRSKLVYQVYDLPQSMFTYIWDYGSLPIKEEKEYIQKIVSKVSEGKSITDIYNKLTENDTRVIANIISECHQFTKTQELADWAVSLRDVNRFTVLFKHFLESNYRRTDGYKYSGEPWDNNKYRALIVSIAFCYYFRIAKNEHRNQLIDQIKPHLLEINIKPENFKNVLEQEQMRYITPMLSEIPKGIGLNTLLKENIFAMIICIQTQIPLFIVGKPGSSKSLAMSLVSQSFKGTASKVQFFKQFPSILSIMYQGSEQSTSTGIEKVFQNAQKKQEYIRQHKLFQQVLVILEEVGLAEVSPHNPLKVLHELLEPQESGSSQKKTKVASIGISNWSLDASKMNRGISLMRPDPRPEDLVESAKKIAENINTESPQKQEIFENGYLDWLMNSYKGLQQHLKNMAQIFGLRDFYCLIKQINRELLTAGEDLEVKNLEICINAIQRNFNGHPDPKAQVLEKFQQIARDKQLPFVDEVSWEPKLTKQLIQQNLEDKNSRNLLICTDSFGKSISFLHRACSAIKRDVKVFYGSDFIEDTAEEAAYKLIRDIVNCMDKGTLCILLNLESIYQSFYDMLNQNYQESDGKRYCKIAIGPDSKMKLVHPDFKCVLLIESHRLTRLDLPLLNRFEKQTFTDDFTMTPQQKQAVGELITWMKTISRFDGFTLEETFPVIDEVFIQGLVLYHSTMLDYESLIKTCKWVIILNGTFAGIMRILKQDKSKLTATQKLQYPECQELAQKYLRKGYYKSLRELIELNLDEPYQNDPKGLNIIVNYYEGQSKRDLSQEFLDSGIICLEKIIYLNEVLSKEKFENDLDYFFNKSENNTLMIMINPYVDSQRRIDLTMSLINQYRSLQQVVDEDSRKHLIILMEIEPSIKKKLYYNDGWLMYTIDFLSCEENETGLMIDDIHIKKFTDLIDYQTFFVDLIKNRTRKAFSKINYDEEQRADGGGKAHVEWLRNKYFQVQKVIEKKEVICHIREYIIKLIERLYNYSNDEWIAKVVFDRQLMVYKSMLRATSQYFMNITVEYLTAILYCLEIEGVIVMIDSNDERTKRLGIAILPKILSEAIDTLQPYQDYNVQRTIQMSKYPFSSKIHSEFDKLREIFVQELKNRANLSVSVEQSEAQFTVQIHQLNMQIESILPVNLRDDHGNGLLSVGNIKDYLNDLSIRVSFKDINVNLHLFFVEAILIFSRRILTSISQIYGIYWRMQKVLEKSIDLINQVSKLIPITQEFCTEFGTIVDQVMEQDVYRDRQSQSYIQRDVFVISLIQFICSKLSPDRIQMNNVTKWYEVTRECYKIVKLMAQERQYKSVELSQIEVIIEFYLQILMNDAFQSLSITDKKIDVQAFQQYQFKLLTLFTSQIKMREAEGSIKFVSDLVSSNKYYEMIEPEKNLIDKILTFLYNIRSNLSNSKHLELFRILVKRSMSKLSSQQTLQNARIDSNDLIRRSRWIHQLAFMINENKTSGDYMIFERIDEKLDRLCEVSPYLKFLQRGIASKLEKLQKKKEFNTESPFCVILCDAIEKTLPIIDGGFVMDCLKSAIEDLLDPKTPLLKLLISMAFFRKVVRNFYDEIYNIVNRAPRSQFGFEEARQILSEHFNKHHLNEIKLFLLKAFNERLDIFMFDEASAMAPWIAQYRAQFIQSMNLYPVSLSTRLTQRSEIWNLKKQEDQLQRLKQLLLGKLPGDQDRFFISSLILEYFYLNSNQTYFLQNIQAEVQASSQLGPKLKTFVIELCKQERQGNQHFNLKINAGLKEIYSFLALVGVMACSMSNENVFGALMERLDSVKDIFIPFIANVKDDFRFFVNLQDGSTFMRWRCKACKFIFIIADCGKISNHRAKKGEMVGAMKCENCGVLLGVGGEANSEQIDKEKKSLKNFTTENEAEKSYIFLNPGEINDIPLRGHKKVTLLVGHLITHATLFVGFYNATSAEKEAFMRQYYLKQAKVGPLNQQTVQKELFEQVESSWVELKAMLKFTHQQMQSMLDEVICQLMSKSAEAVFKLESLRTIEGRKAFELAVGRLIKKDEQELSQLQLQCNGKKDDVTQLINEQATPNAYMSLLRFQKMNTFNNFERAVNLDEVPEAKKLQQMLKFNEQLQKIRQLKHLIKWTNLVNQVWGNKITKEDAISMSIQEKIDEQARISREAFIKQITDKTLEIIPQLEADLNTMQQVIRAIESTMESDDIPMAESIYSIIQTKPFVQQLDMASIQKRLLEEVGKLARNKPADVIKKAYQKFEVAWNNFVGRAYDFQCDSLKVNKVSLKTKFINCCVTNKQFDNSGGLTYFYLMKDLAEMQNTYLENIKGQQKSKENSFPLMKLSRKQIITKGMQREQTDKILQHFNSFNAHKFREGQSILYDLKSILQECEDTMLAGKVFIETDCNVNFPYSNVDSPYEEFDIIRSRIAKQTRNPMCEQVIEVLNDRQRHLLFNDDLRITFNLLKQTGGEANQPLVQYMRAFNMRAFEKEISPEIKLRHFLHFYEVTEGACMAKLIEKTNVECNEALPQFELSLLQREVTSKFMENEEEILQVHRMMQRMCVRQLSATLQLSKDVPFFYCLFMEENMFLRDIGAELPQERADYWSESLSVCTEIRLKNALPVCRLFDEFKQEVTQRRLDRSFHRAQAVQTVLSEQNSEEPDGGDNVMNFLPNTRLMHEEVLVVEARNVAPEISSQPQPVGRGGRGAIRQDAQYMVPQARLAGEY